MNKIIFCSEPDTLPGTSFALKNFSNDTIKHLLNVCTQDTQFYLIEDTSSTEWKEQIKNTITKTFDCSIDSLAYIVEHAR